MANLNISALRFARAPQPGGAVTRTQADALRGYRRGAVVRSLDAMFGGRARFEGTVLVIETPAPTRRVRLHDFYTGALVAETWSDPTGAFEFRNLKVQPYYLLAFDQNGGYDPTASPVLSPA